MFPPLKNKKSTNQGLFLSFLKLVFPFWILLSRYLVYLE